MAYEFLKKLFGTQKDGEEPKAMTYAQLEAAIDADKKIQVVDVKAGGYVSKEKLDAKITELDGVRQQLTDANAEIKSYKEMDIDGIKKSAKDWEDKYNHDTQELNDKLAKQETSQEGTLSSSIKQNAESITSKVSKGEMGSYITQYYNNVIIAFNKNSKYVQINPGEIAIYNYGVENSKKRAVFDESGNHFYRDGYYVGAIGTNQWSGNNAHKGLVFDLEPQGKYMAFAQKASSSATSYTTMLCFSRANSIYDEYGVNLGCNLIGNWYTLKNFKIGSISAGGYTAFSGSIPIVCEITNNGNSWTYSHLRVYNGIIVGYWN